MFITSRLHPSTAMVPPLRRRHQHELLIGQTVERHRGGRLRNRSDSHLRGSDGNSARGGQRPRSLDILAGHCSFFWTGEFRGGIVSDVIFKSGKGLILLCNVHHCVLQLLSAAEDSLVRVWHLTMTPETNSVEVAVLSRNTVQCMIFFWARLWNAHLVVSHSVVLTVFFSSDPLSGCSFAQRVCDRHTDLWRQVLRWRRLCLCSDRLWPEWDYPLHTDLSICLSCGNMYKCTFVLRVSK